MSVVLWPKLFKSHKSKKKKKSNEMKKPKKMKIYLAANKNKRIRNGNFPIAHQMPAQPAYRWYLLGRLSPN
jgi:hypothetical protein